METLLYKICLKNGYSLKLSDLREQLESDPQFPNLSALTETLNFFNIKNIVANIPNKSLEGLPDHFLAQLNSKIVFVSKITYNKLRITTNESRSYLLEFSDFQKKWTGLFVAIEKNNIENRFSKVIIEKVVLLASISLIFFYILNIPKQLYSNLYIILSVLGLITSYFIVIEKFLSNKLTSKFCSINKNTNCEKVLNYNVLLFRLKITFVDITVLYFTFMLIAYIIEPQHLIFAISSYLSLPIIAYSLYLQYKIIKRWCPLCLITAGILLCQFTILLYSEYYIIDVRSSLLFLALATILSSIWREIRHILFEKEENVNLRIENLTFKRKVNLFLPYYNSLDTIELTDEPMGEIRIGSLNPTIRFTIISNPSCHNCREAHKDYMHLLKLYPNKTEVKIRFLIPINDPSNIQTKIAIRLSQLYCERSESEFLISFNECFQISNKNWLKKWGECKGDFYKDALTKQILWSLKNGIDTTPQFLVNGKLMPAIYSLKDMLRFVDFLPEEPAISNEKIKNFRARMRQKL